MSDDLTPTPEDYAVDPREILTVGCRDSTYAALLALARRLIAEQVETARLRAELADANSRLDETVWPDD